MSSLGSIDEQKRLVNLTANLPILTRYPLQPRYVESFLRAIIDELENQSIEIADELYEKMCDTFEQKEETDYSFKHFIPNFNDDLCFFMKENKNKISQGTTGLNMWESTFAMAELAFCRKQLFEGLKVLELGAGCGFTGIVIAKYCEPKQVTISDGDYTVLDLLEENVSFNFEIDDNNQYYDGRTGTVVSKGFFWRFSNEISNF